MKGVILAAGRGRRLGELTEKKPKCFLKVDGMRLIDWQISAFRSNGINDITAANMTIGGLIFLLFAYLGSKLFIG